MVIGNLCDKDNIYKTFKLKYDNIEVTNGRLGITSWRTRLNGMSGKGKKLEKPNASISTKFL